MAKTIAVAGKGGTGKSTVAALVIQRLRAKGFGPILAIDADPDANLGNLLGMRNIKTIGDLREDVLKEVKNFPAGMNKASYVEAGLHQIIAEADGFDFIAMGRSEGAGCYCYMNSLIRKFHEDLTPSYAWVVFDNEAGLEHISRRTTSKIDVLLIVVNDNPISLETAGKIVQLTDSLPGSAEKRYILANMVREDRLPYVEKWAQENKIDYAGHLPRTSAIEDAIMNGASLLSLKHPPTRDRISAILEKIGSVA